MLLIRKSAIAAALLACAALPLHAQDALTCCPEQPGTAKQKLLWHKLQQQLAQEVEQFDGAIAVGIYDLKSGAWLMVHGDEIMPQASTIKIAVLLELHRQVQQGKHRLEDLYVVRAEDVVQDSEMLGALTPGASRVTLRDLATMMMAVSDNGATNVLIDRLGMDNVNQMLYSLGLRNTKLRRKMLDLKAASEGRENVSTVREMLWLLRMIYEGKALNAQFTAEFWKMLATPKPDSHMRAAIPANVAVASKHGWLEGVRTESGVVMLKERPFAISVMTAYVRDEKEAEAVITRITRRAHDYFDRLCRSSDYGRVVSTR